MYGVGMSDLRAYKWDIGGMAIPGGQERDIAAELIALNEVVLDSDKNFNSDNRKIFSCTSTLTPGLEQIEFRKRCFSLLGITEKQFQKKFALVRWKMSIQYASIYDSYSGDPAKTGAHWDHQVKKNFNELFDEDDACLPDIYSKRLIKEICNRGFKRSS
jgi:hypothetical protein